MTAESSALEWRLNHATAAAAAAAAAAELSSSTPHPEPAVLSSSWPLDLCTATTHSSTQHITAPLHCTLVTPSPHSSSFVVERSPLNATCAQRPPQPLFLLPSPLRYSLETRSLLPPPAMDNRSAFEVFDSDGDGAINQVEVNSAAHSCTWSTPCCCHSSSAPSRHSLLTHRPAVLLPSPLPARPRPPLDGLQPLREAGQPHPLAQPHALMARLSLPLPPSLTLTLPPTLPRRWPSWPLPAPTLSVLAAPI